MSHHNLLENVFILSTMGNPSMSSMIRMTSCRRRPGGYKISLVNLVWVMVMEIVMKGCENYLGHWLCEGAHSVSDVWGQWRRVI
jgi:hypothetical protein